MQERIVRPRQASSGYNFFPAITREGKHDADLSATAAAASLLEGMAKRQWGGNHRKGLKGGMEEWRGETDVIYCDLIAFNSTRATVNHRVASCAGQVTPRYRYAIIISINGS